MTLNAKYISDEEVSHGTDIAFCKDSDIMAYSFYARAYTIDYKVLPADATDKIVTWTINDEAIATVDEYGTVIFSTPGEVVITGHLKSGKSRDFRLKAIEGPLPSPEDVLAPSLIEMDIDEKKPWSFPQNRTLPGYVPTATAHLMKASLKSMTTAYSRQRHREKRKSS